MNISQIADAATNYRIERYVSCGTEPQYGWQDVHVAFVAGAMWQADQPTEQRLVPRMVLGLDTLEEQRHTKDQLADARRQIEEMEKRQDNFRSTIGNLVDAERSYILTIDRRTEERNLFADKIRDLEAANSRQTKAMGNYRDELGKKEARINTLNDQLDVKREDIARLGATNKRQAEMILALQDDVKAAENKSYEELGDQMRRLGAERDDWHHAYDRLVSDVVHGRNHHIIGMDVSKPGSDMSVVSVSYPNGKAREIMETEYDAINAATGYCDTEQACDQPEAMTPVAEPDALNREEFQAKVKRMIDYSFDQGFDLANTLRDMWGKQS